MQGIKVITPRLTQQDAINIYGSPYLPLVHHEDPLFPKLVRHSHLRYTVSRNPIHLSTKGTQANLLKGSCGIYTFRLTALLTQYLFGCNICNLERSPGFTPAHGPRYTGLKTEAHPFQHISADFLVPINC